MTNAQRTAVSLVACVGLGVCVPVAGAEATRGLTQPLMAIPQLVPAPKDNPTTPAKVALGNRLFLDPRLSGDNTLSCASCHSPEKAFSDGLPRSRGADGKISARNAPTLLNVGLHSTLFWDGRAANLEEQALMPLAAANEMHQNVDELVVELAAIPEYSEQFAEVFGRPVTKHDIARALAAFQRTLLSRNSAFDRYVAGDTDALSPMAKEGLELFTGAADCIRCHNGPLLSDGKYYRLGIGRDDRGRATFTQQRDDLYKFRTPSLRDVAKTGPYMHDGSKATLNEVVQFYYRDAGSRGPDGLDLDIEPLLAQSYSEISAIVAFLESLSGDSGRRH